MKALGRIVLLALLVTSAVACDSGGGGKIQPLSGLGPSSSASGAKSGPHPMPGQPKTNG